MSSAAWANACSLADTLQVSQRLVVGHATSIPRSGERDSSADAAALPALHILFASHTVVSDQLDIPLPSLPFQVGCLLIFCLFSLSVVTITPGPTARSEAHRPRNDKTTEGVCLPGRL